MSEQSFYVYVHIRLDTFKVFYIGKGVKARISEKSRRNKYWNSIVKKHGYVAKILKSNLSEKQAFDIELKYLLVAKKNNRAEANLIVGDQRSGKGSTWSDGERRLKARDRWLRNNPTKKGNIPWNKGKVGAQEAWNKGKSWGLETRQKISKATKGREAWNKGLTPDREMIIKQALGRGCKPFKAIRLSDNTVVWTGLLQTECLDFLGIKHTNKGNLNSCLKGKRKSLQGYRFEYV